MRLLLENHSFIMREKWEIDSNTVLPITTRRNPYPNATNDNEEKYGSYWRCRWYSKELMRTTDSSNNRPKNVKMPEIM